MTSVLCNVPDSPVRLILSAGDLCAIIRRNLIYTYNGTERLFSPENEENTFCALAFIFP